MGGALGLAFSTLDKMKDVPSEVAAAWLLKQDNVMTVSGEPTWRALVDALRKEGQEGTAREIEEIDRKSYYINMRYRYSAIMCFSCWIYQEKYSFQ